MLLLLENNYEAADMRHCQYNAALSISQTRSASLPTAPGATKTARPFKQRGTPRLEQAAPRQLRLYLCLQSGKTLSARSNRFSS